MPFLRESFSAFKKSKAKMTFTTFDSVVNVSRKIVKIDIRKIINEFISRKVSQKKQFSLQQVS